MFLGYRPSQSRFWLLGSGEEVLDELILGVDPTAQYFEIRDVGVTVTLRPVTLRTPRSENVTADIFELEVAGQVVATRKIPV